MTIYSLIQIKQVENLVNEKIMENIPVTIEYTTMKEAQNKVRSHFLVINIILKKCALWMLPIFLQNCVVVPMYHVRAILVHLKLLK